MLNSGAGDDNDGGAGDDTIIRVVAVRSIMMAVMGPTRINFNNLGRRF